MGWKEKQDEVRARLESTLSKQNWDWLKRAVNWEAGDVWEATTTEIRIWFGRPNNANGISDSGLCHTLIWQRWIKVQVSEADSVNGNLRSLWYQTIEPFYREHGLLPKSPDREDLDLDLERGPGHGDSVESKLYRSVLAWVGDFVRHRVFGYSDELKFWSPPDARWVIGRDRPKFLFYTEKEGLWQALCLPISEGGEDGLESRISVMATRGQPPFVSVEYVAREMQALKDPVVHLVNLVFADHDPWGLRIAEQIDAKMRFFGFRSVTTYRLVTLDLFTPRNIKGAKDLSNMPNSNIDIDHWMAETGGVNGQKLGIHCDVIHEGRRDEVIKKMRLGIRTNTLAERFPLVKPIPLDELGDPDEPTGRLYN